MLVPLALAPWKATLSQVAINIHVARNLWWSRKLWRTSSVARCSNTESVVCRYEIVPPLFVFTSAQNGAIIRHWSPRGKAAGVYWRTAVRNEITPFVFTWNRQRKTFLLYHTLFWFYILFKYKKILTVQSITEDEISKYGKFYKNLLLYKWDAKMIVESQHSLWHCAEFLETTNLEQRWKGNFYHFSHSDDYKLTHKPS